MRPKTEILELIKRNDPEGYNQYMESQNEALYRELALTEEFFIMDMSEFENDIKSFGVSRDSTLLTSIATRICEELGYPDQRSIKSISHIIEYNHIDNYFVSHDEHDKIMAKMTTEATNTIVPTTDHKVNTPIMTTNTNNSNTVQTTELNTIETVQNAVRALALAKGSRFLGTLETIKSLVITRPFEARSKTFNLSKNICKRLNIDVSDNVEFIASVIWESIEELIISIIEAKPTKTTRTGGVLHSETVTYAVRVLNGGLIRSNRVASALERVALRMVAIGDFNIEDMPVSLDSELNKAYSAIRSQATKNGEELGGKSNAVTKTATKEAIVKAIQIMKETDSYEYDILIGNIPKQPKHLKE